MAPRIPRRWATRRRQTQGDRGPSHQSPQLRYAPTWAKCIPTDRRSLSSCSATPIGDLPSVPRSRLPPRRSLLRVRAFDRHAIAPGNGCLCSFVSGREWFLSMPSGTIARHSGDRTPAARCCSFFRIFRYIGRSRVRAELRGDQNCARSQPKLVTTAAAPMRAQGDEGVSAGFARTQVKPTRLPSANQKAPPCTCTLSHARQ